MNKESIRRVASACLGSIYIEEAEEDIVEVLYCFVKPDINEEMTEKELADSIEFSLNLINRGPKEEDGNS